MDGLDDIRADFQIKRPDVWDKLPDIDLYMDQVISFLGRTQLAPAQSQKLTAAMVNNYVKEGLLPRSNKKRYDRNHVALLHIFVALKEVMSVTETGRLLNLYVDVGDVPARYNLMLDKLGEALDRALSEIPEHASRDLLVEAALTFALNSYASKMAAQRLLELIDREIAYEAAEKSRQAQGKAESMPDKSVATKGNDNEGAKE